MTPGDVFVGGLIVLGGAYTVCGTDGGRAAGTETLVRAPYPLITGSGLSVLEDVRPVLPLFTQSRR